MKLLIKYLLFYLVVIICIILPTREKEYSEITSIDKKYWAINVSFNNFGGKKQLQDETFYLVIFTMCHVKNDCQQETINSNCKLEIGKQQIFFTCSKGTCPTIPINWNTLIENQKQAFVSCSTKNKEKKENYPATIIQLIPENKNNEKVFMIKTEWN